MHLLKTRSNILGMFMANFAEKPLSPEEAEAQRKAIAEQKKALLRELPTASTLPGGVVPGRTLRGQIVDTNDVFMRGAKGESLAPDDIARANQSLAAIAENESRMVDEAGRTPLKKMVGDTELVEQSTRNPVRGVVPISPSSPIGAKLTGIQQQVDEYKRDASIREGRLSPEGDALRAKKKETLDRAMETIALQKEQVRQELVDLQTGPVVRAASNRKGVLTKARDALNTAKEDAITQLFNQGITNPTEEQIQEAIGAKKYGSLKERFDKAASATESDNIALTKKQRELARKEKALVRGSAASNKLKDAQSWAGARDETKGRVTTPQGVDSPVPLTSTPQRPTPSYAVKTPDGKIDPGRIELRPKRGGALNRRLDALNLVDKAVTQASASSTTPSIQSLIASKTAIPTNTTNASTFLQTLKGKAKSTAGLAGRVAGKAKQNVQQRNANVNASVAARKAAGAVPPTTTSTPAPPPPPHESPPPTPKAKKDKGFKGKVTTPKGVYEAELDVPEWLSSGKKATETTVKPVQPTKIANTIRDGNLLGKVKDYYKNLSPSTKKAALGGGLALGGIGLLAAGSQKAAQDRNSQESRTRELAAIASRPPALPENQLPYDPYQYSGYPY